ncbi:AraC family transcriptional regulator [Microbacterium sp. SD291]|uniref:helix-turn-helix transcriptional regulator n=1 Tax=Microbacterium sp. SD291 TaxID=2782007 RepID=UPI001A963591|nr:AraC family transcriptional regulator [Microbacterium sp. SD291]MBO0979518.1 helix-turn-helix domain-containing protein [Microbacterium sp. SD291]
MSPDQFFEAHSHERDQLAWIPGGARIRVADSHWRLQGDQFAWIPALAEHDMQMSGAEEMFSLYLDPSIRLPQSRWNRPLALPVDPVAGAIVRSLCTSKIDGARVDASIALLMAILAVTDESYDALAVPHDPRARAVADAILLDPAEERGLDDWAQQLGVSTKTLHRAFLADTGLTFSQWRTRARIYAAERLLAEGHSVQETSERTGYATSTGFIKAFRQVFGATPASYARAKKALPAHARARRRRP